MESIFISYHVKKHATNTIFNKNIIHNLYIRAPKMFECISYFGRKWLKGHFMLFDAMFK